MSLSNEFPEYAEFLLSMVQEPEYQNYIRQLALSYDDEVAIAARDILQLLEAENDIVQFAETFFTPSKIKGRFRLLEWQKRFLQSIVARDILQLLEADDTRMGDPD